MSCIALYCSVMRFCSGLLLVLIFSHLQNDGTKRGIKYPSLVPFSSIFLVTFYRQCFLGFAP